MVCATAGSMLSGLLADVGGDEWDPADGEGKGVSVMVSSLGTRINRDCAS